MLIHQQFKDGFIARQAAQMLRQRFGIAEYTVTISKDGRTIAVDIGAMELLPNSPKTIQMQHWLEGIDVGTTRF